MRQQNNYGGGIVSFFCRRRTDAAWRFADALRVFSITANFGDAKSTITHPFQHDSFAGSGGNAKKLGVTDGLLRLSAGLEDADDLEEDLSRGLRVLEG